MLSLCYPYVLIVLIVLIFVLIVSINSYTYRFQPIFSDIDLVKFLLS